MIGVYRDNGELEKLYRKHFAQDEPLDCREELLEETNGAISSSNFYGLLNFYLGLFVLPAFLLWGAEKIVRYCNRNKDKIKSVQGNVKSALARGWELFVRGWRSCIHYRRTEITTALIMSSLLIMSTLLIIYM